MKKLIKFSTSRLPGMENGDHEKEFDVCITKKNLVSEIAKSCGLSNFWIKAGGSSKFIWIGSIYEKKTDNFLGQVSIHKRYF